MRKLISIALIIVMLLCMTSCGNDGNYPKDDGERCVTSSEAIFGNDGIGRKPLFELVCGNFVRVAFEDKFSILYMDNEGYFPIYSSKLKFSTLTVEMSEGKYPGAGGSFWVTFLANKHVISFSTVTQYLDRTIELHDNIGTEIKYGEYADEDTKWMSYFWVLDEIPEDYRVIINGKEYELPKKNYTAEIVFGLLGLGIVTAITVIVLKKTRHNRKMKKYKDIF